MRSENDAEARGMVEDPGGCHYIPDRLMVRPEDLQSAIDTLRGGGFQVEDATEETISGLDEGFETRQGPAHQSPIGAIRMIDTNPHRGADFLAHTERSIEAAPIHGVGYEGHAGFMSGDGPGLASDLEAPDERDIEGMVAVIDSGIAREESRPWWMSGDYVDAEAVDIEPVAKGEASHGTFVASVIRKLAPTHGIAFAAARPDRDGNLRSRHGSDPADPPTHELEVLDAVLRLVRRYKDDPSRIAALNLSLGAARCGANQGFLLTLRIALEVWQRHFGHEPRIFAAGGNGPSPLPVYPGAFDWVHAVAAGNGGKQVVWRHGAEEPALPRAWITDVAPGVKIHGLSGASETDTIWWSGSSFATAVATSLSVSGETFEVMGADTYWQDLAVDYTAIDGLEHG